MSACSLCEANVPVCYRHDLGVHHHLANVLDPADVRPFRCIDADWRAEEWYMGAKVKRSSYYGLQP